GMEFPGQFSPRYYLLQSDTPNGFVQILVGSVFIHQDAQQYFQTKDDNLLQRVTLRPQNGEPIILKSRYEERLGRETPYASSNVAHILEKCEEGYSHAQILAEMPWLEPEDIQACLVYARQGVEKK